jgi:hypothetical protein
LNFCKYEDAIDTFMPPSRRTGSEETKYCESNREAIAVEGHGRKHNAIASCKTINELCAIMNPRGRYYKLNMQNLVTGRQLTLEFRQHSGTSNYNKVVAWVRFCMAMVNNSARQPRPAALKEHEEAFDLLFDTVIQDLALKQFFLKRKMEIQTDEADGIGVGTKRIRDQTPSPTSVEQADSNSCCDGCAHGQTCSS